MPDPSDRSFVVAAHRVDAPDFGCGLQLSGNAGRGWVPASPVPRLPAGAEKCYNPEVAFDGLGRLYYLFVGLAGNGNRPIGAFLTVSDDRARTFSPPRPVLGPNSFGVRMAVDAGAAGRGRVHLVWIRAGSDPAFGGFAATVNPVLTAHSDDGGDTFSAPVQVNSSARSRVVAPAIAVGPGRRVAVAFYDLGSDVRDYQGLPGPTWGGEWSLIVRTSAHGNGQFGTEEVADNAIVPAERVLLIFTMAPPALVSTPNGGLCLAWTDARAGDPDAIARCRDSRPGRWGDPRRLNDDPIGTGRRQYLPRLSVAPDGRIDAAFFDRRIDQYGRLADVAFTFSRDGGRRFAPNIKLNSQPSNTQIGPRYAVASAAGQVEIGSRLGLLSSASGALVAWADTRNSDPMRTGQDVFATAVDGLGEDRSFWSGGTMVAVATGVIAVVLVDDRRRRQHAHRSD